MAESSISTGLGRLALTPTSKTKITLNADIWHLVFVEIIKDSNMFDPCGDNGHNTNHMSKAELRPWLHDTRLVSHEFDVILKRHAYESIDFSKTSFRRRFTPVTAPPCEVKNNIREYTKVLELSPDWDGGAKEFSLDFLDSCFHLQRVLCYNSGHNSTLRWSEYSAILISQYLNAFMHSKKRIEALTRYRMRIESSSFEFEAVDDTRKNSSKSSPEPGESTPDQQILEVFTIENKWGWPFQLETLSYPVPCAKRLPPMRKLEFIGYHWIYSESDFGLVWDFSYLRVLRICNVSIKHFSKNAPIKHMKNLQKLEVISSIFVIGSDTDRRLLFNGFVTQLSALQNFKVEDSSWMEYVGPDLLARIGSGLRSLHLVRADRHDLISERLLVSIIESCPKLEKIGLGYDDSRTKISDILDVLVSVEHLQKIRFYAQNKIIWHDNVNQPQPGPTADADYVIAERVMRYLHSKKLGKALLSVKIVQYSAPMPPRWRPENWKSLDMKFDLDSVNGPSEVRKRQSAWGNHVRRTYESRIINGIYEQLGSERFEFPLQEISSNASDTTILETSQSTD